MQRYPSYDHWKAMGFILLGDVYVQLNDPLPSARHLAKRVTDYCQEPDLVAQARQRLEAINASDVQQNAPRQQEDITIPMPGIRNGQ